jgi:hypothetical protein
LLFEKDFWVLEYRACQALTLQYGWHFPSILQSII